MHRRGPVGGGRPSRQVSVQPHAGVETHNESTAFIDSDRPSRARTATTDAPGALDWQSLSTRYFPGRRRHDLEALTAYGTYRRRPRPPQRCAREEGAQADRPAQADDGALVGGAVQTWEAEGSSRSSQTSSRRIAKTFFVKNLERVRGDERDAIILSIGYGKNTSRPSLDCCRLR